MVQTEEIIVTSVTTKTVNRVWLRVAEPTYFDIFFSCLDVKNDAFSVPVYLETVVAETNLLHYFLFRVAFRNPNVFGLLCCTRATSTEKPQKNRGHCRFSRALLPLNLECVPLSVRYFFLGLYNDSFV